LKNGTSDRSTRSIASILKSPTADKSEKSTRSVTFVDEDTELGPHKDSSEDIQFSDSNLSANECKRSLSLKYKKSRISKEGRKLRHIKNLNKEQRKSESDFLAGCPFELNFDFDRSDFDLRNFDLSNFGLSMIFGAFDCFGRNRCYDLTPSFDDDDDNKEGDDNEEGMEKPKEALNPAFETELVQFPQPRWSNSMATAE